MTTYLAATDGTEASRAISDHLDDVLDEGDAVVGIHASGEPDEDAMRGLELLEERLDGLVDVTTRQIEPGTGGGPVETIVDEINEAEADVLVAGLRRHTRTERIIFGSVSHELVETVTVPLLLVPLPEYQPPEA